VKIVQVCSPKWYRVKPIAWVAASMDSGSTPCRGGLAKWFTGSATAQNIRIVPMPAANSIANQERLVCSGRSSSAPRRTWPNRLTAR